MSFTTQHWNDCYDERYCAGKTCGYSCHCKYDDVFSIGSLPERSEPLSKPEGIALQVGILGTMFALSSMSHEERVKIADKAIAKEKERTKELENLLEEQKEKEKMSIKQLQGMLEEMKNLKPFMDANHISQDNLVFKGKL